ncbi:MAG: polyprenyl synthetase family protein [Armatimonadetes bacterium]|nr:polyprenyl synthetase family protein [Armatimonadota bacterium]
MRTARPEQPFLGDPADFHLKAYMKERAGEIDRALDRILSQDRPYLGNIGETMRYCVFPGGKRFRPVLTMAACEAVGSPRQRAVPAACAFEMIHCFSLAHDDLPCMDDDEVRRDKPTCHIAHGEDAALLAGDGLAVWAFYVAASTPEGVSAEAALEVVRELALASGHPGMIGGQVLDLEGQRGGVDADGLRAIHEAKTGALIRGAVRCGAIAGGATPAQLEALTGYAERVGLVFQITDDILDAEEDPERVSFPAVYGMEESRRLAAEAVAEALGLLRCFGPEALPLRSLASYLLNRKS